MTKSNQVNSFKWNVYDGGYNDGNDDDDNDDDLMRVYANYANSNGDGDNVSCVDFLKHGRQHDENQP